MGIVQDEISAKHFLHAIIDFGYISGLTLNMTKTEAVWLGVNRNQTDKPSNIRWPALPSKVLDVYFGYVGELCEKRNFGDKIDKAKQIINMWKQKDLSLIGCVQINKTLCGLCSHKLKNILITLHPVCLTKNKHSLANKYCYINRPEWTHIKE